MNDDDDDDDCDYIRVACDVAIRECMVVKGQYIIQPCNLQSVL